MPDIVFAVNDNSLARAIPIYFGNLCVSPHEGLNPRIAWVSPNLASFAIYHSISNNIRESIIFANMLRYLIILLLPLTIFSQILWDNFEDTRIGYYDFVHGGMTTSFENPSPSSSINSSSLCAQYVRNPGETYDVIVIVANGPFSDLTDYLNSSKKMKVDVFSPAPGIPLQITLEDSAIAGATNYPDGRHSIYTAQTTVSNAWETVEFTFDSRPDNNVPDENVTSLILLFDIGNNTNDTYYFDNLYGPEFNNQCDGISSNPLINLADWDCHWNLGICPSATSCNSFDYISGWLNHTYNPDVTTINSSKYSGEYTSCLLYTSDAADE